MSKKVTKNKATTREKKLYSKQRDMINDYYGSVFNKKTKLAVVNLNMNGYTDLRCNSEC